MHFRLSVLIALCSFLLPLTHVFAQDTTPPTGTLFLDPFNTVDQAWQPVSGTWSIGNGTYGNASATGTNITIVTGYEGVGLHGLGSDKIESSDFTVSARMRNQGTTDAHLVGLVYGYQDAQNYYEVVISALGNVTMRTVMNGVAVDENVSTHLDIPRNTWFSVGVHWKQGLATLSINGLAITSASQPEFTSGRAGLVTHNAVGRFDLMNAETPFGDQGFYQLFDDTHGVPFSAVSGQWVIESGIYRNDAVQQTSITLAPVNSGTHDAFGETTEFTFRARMLNPYAGAGNLVGIVFNYETSTRYSEVVFSPTGVAKVNRIVNGVATTVATANYGGTRNVAFDVALEWLHGIASVLVNGQRIFTNVFASPSTNPHGPVGLITHWAPGRFDSIEFDPGIFGACSKTFSSSSELPTPTSGTWDVSGGTLNSTAVGQSDIVAFSDCQGNDVGQDLGTNFVYGARLLNEFGASGNLVGVVYDYEDSNNYYEVVFSSTGSMQLNKVFEGVKTTVATATHTVPRNTWFNVQVVRTANSTGIQINGITVIRNLQQSELRSGTVGVITHWTRGHFDNVSLTDRPDRPPTEL